MGSSLKDKGEIYREKRQVQIVADKQAAFRGVETKRSTNTPATQTSFAVLTICHFGGVQR